MMRSMRAIVKPVFYVLAISFVAWLAIGQVTDILGGGKDVVLKVNGEVVRSQPFQLQYQAALEQYRRQQGGARLSREDEQQVQNQVADQFIHNILLERAYRRLGITVSDEEIIRAARSGPPPQLMQQLQQYYQARKNDFKRPAAAWLSYIAQPRVADARDSAAALARVRALRAEITGGKAKFEDVAKKESSDSGTGARGGDLGWIKRTQPGFDPRFVAGLRSLPVGVVSEPVLSSFGYHLIRIDAAKGDSVHARHLLVAIAPQGQHLDAIDARTDTLDKLAGDQTDGRRPASGAHAATLPLARAPKLVQGERLVLPEGPVPDVSVWAFDARAGETSPVIDGPRASYVFRLDSLDPAGVPPLAQLRARVLDEARHEKKKTLARQHAEQVAGELRGASDLLAAARAHGLRAQKEGPFTRVTAAPEFTRNPVMLGAAFALRPGERSPLIAGETGFFLLQGIARTSADSAAWQKQRDQQRETLIRPIEQARIQQYLAALRAQATIVDRRNEIFRPAAAASESYSLRRFGSPLEGTDPDAAGGTLRGGVSGWASPVAPLRLRLNSLIPCPREDPISGIRFAPNTSTSTSRRIRMWLNDRSPNIDASRQKIDRAT